MSEKSCKICGQVKHLALFHRDRGTRDGHRNVCKVCDHARHAEYVKANQARLRSYRKQRYRDNPEREREKNAANYCRHLLRNMLKRTRVRSAQKGVPYDLDMHAESLRDRLERGVCELTGLPLVVGGGRGPFSPSIDRINPEAGYVYANVRIVCHAMNCALGTWGEDVLRTIVEAWAARSGDGGV